MKPAISVDRLTKQFHIPRGGGASARRTFREAILGAAAAPWHRLRRRLNRARRAVGANGPVEAAADRDTETIWALKDVSFEVEPGEVVGVIGRNGAGKSTLLKVVSRITQPTSGQIALRGRVGSLLEVGTGFHSELTGRENIYLNGAILGMSRREVARKFDAIVDFAEVERFLDTPVKRYSSGMYMRLAFAVASHLEPEILIVDEVLAVGDASFQQKCLGRMNEVSKQGRTVLFVSHQMSAVKSLCSRAILIEGGKVAQDGGVDDVVASYLRVGSETSHSGVIPENASRQRDVPDEALFRSVRLTDQSGRDVSQLYFGQPFRVGFRCDVLRDLKDMLFEVSISSMDGTHVLCATTLDGGRGPHALPRGTHEGWVDFDVCLLPRQYTVDLAVHHYNGTTSDYVQRTLDFQVLRVAETGADNYRWDRTRGLVRPVTSWDLQTPEDGGAR
jgi:lipopolysaccharide transport system ATP-binding protein